MAFYAVEVPSCQCGDSHKLGIFEADTPKEAIRDAIQWAIISPETVDPRSLEAYEVEPEDEIVQGALFAFGDEEDE